MFSKDSKRYFPFFKQLLPYLKASIPLTEAIQITGENVFIFSAFAKKLLPFLQQGYRLSLLLDLFNAPHALIEWIKIGEETGRLSEAIAASVKLHESQKKLEKTWVQILRYPLFLLIFMISTLWILYSAVFPTLTKLYGEKPLPYLSILIFHHPLIFSGLLLLTPVLLSLILIPFKRLQHLLNLCEKLAIQLEAGLPLIHAAPKPWQFLLSQGYRLSIVLSLQKGDPFLIHLVSVGEKTGNLQESFVQAQCFYQEKLLLYLERLQAYLPGILMAVMAGFIGTLVFSIYLPLLNLSF